MTGGEFALIVLGYQFPGTTEGYDANWLTVGVSVSSTRSSWKATSACILTWDLLSLIYWLDDLETDEAEPWCGLGVVGIVGRRCLYFNLVEHGWGWGRFSEWGTISEYHWQQDELHHVIGQTLFAIDSGGDG